MIINQWLSDITGGMIPEIVPAYGTICTKIVCTNALLLNAKWRHGYNVGDEKLEFKNSDGTYSKVTALINMMDYKYTETPEALLIDIPLGFLEDQMTYTLILPKGEGIDGTELIPLTAQSVNSPAQEVLIKLTMPEFEVNTDLDDLRGALENLGMIDAFNEQ